MEQMIKDLFLNEASLDLVYVVSIFEVLSIPGMRIEYGANALSKDAGDFLWLYLKMAHEHEANSPGYYFSPKYEIYTSIINDLVNAGLQVDFDDMRKELEMRIDDGSL